MRALSVVWWKEVRENLRDRRTMVSTFVLGPLFGPVLFAVLIGFVAKTELDRAEKALELPVIGAEHAPNLMNWLGAQGVEAVDPPAEPEEAVRTREVELVLRIDDEYGKALGEGRPAPLTLIFDQSQTKARASIERVQALLQGYGELVARQRLLIRGMDPSLVGPIELRRVDLSTPQSRSAMILFVLLPLAALPIELLAAGLRLWSGADESARGLGTLALKWAHITLPLSLFSLATLCRRVGFAWAKIDWGHGALCILAVLMLIYQLPGVLKVGVQPAAVPVVSWLVFAMYLACGAGLWLRQRWLWLLAGMLPGVLLLLVPPGVAGPLPLYLGKLLILAAMTVTMVHFTRLFPVVHSEPSE